MVIIKENKAIGRIPWEDLANSAMHPPASDAAGAAAELDNKSDGSNTHSGRKRVDNEKCINE